MIAIMYHAAGQAQQCEYCAESPHNRYAHVALAGVIRVGYLAAYQTLQYKHSLRGQS